MSNHSPQGRKRRYWNWSTRVLVAALLASLLPALALALPDDRDQPIRITADTAVRDEKQGFTVYSGNVHMIQGSMDIVADTLTIFHETEQADKIIAEGKPAKMHQRPALDKPLVHARADIIEYYKTEDRVHLKINAHITQDGSSVTGDSIDYYIAEELVKAGSEQSPDGQRVEVVIIPDVIREADAADTITVDDAIDSTTEEEAADSTTVEDAANSTAVEDAVDGTTEEDADNGTTEGN